MKKIFLTLIIGLNIVFVGFSQEIQKLTFLDMRSNGTIIGNVTVNAVFMFWSQQRVSIENGMQIRRESLNINGEWSPWEIMGREPAIVPTIRQAYDLTMQEYNRYPRAAVRINMQEGIQAVRIMSIPYNRSSPLWWSDDGKSFNIFCEVWAIMP